MIRGMKSGLKRLRGSQPLNWAATSGVRAVLSLGGLHSEFVIKHLHRVGSVRSQLPNRRDLRLWSNADDWVSNQIFWRGWSGYEPETAPLFYRLATRSAVTLDVGAYVGLFSLLAGHANPSGRIFAFEPMPAIYRRLKINVGINKLVNIESVNAAVGEAEGTAEFYHQEGLEFPSSSSLSSEFMSSASDVIHSTVPLISLDQFVQRRGIGRIDLMKIDTESTEPQVLRGMPKTLLRDRPTIFCEVLSGRGSERPLEEILRPLGYQFYLLTPEGPEHRQRIEGHPQWLNYLFSTCGPAEVVRL